MTKILTEYDEFTSDIYVPEGSDSRDHAAEDVELIAQRLTNRTKNLLTHSAKRDAPNTFVGDQTITGALSVSGAARLPTIAGPTTITGNLTGTANISAATIDAIGDLFAGDDVIATDQVSAGHSVLAHDDFQYSPYKTITKAISPLAFMCLPVGTSGSGWYGEGAYVEMAAGGGVVHVVRAPDGGSLGEVKLKVQAVLSDATLVVKLKRRYNISMGNGVLPTYDDVSVNSGMLLTLNQITVVATADGILAPLTFGDLGVSKGEDYLIYVQCKAGSVGNIRLYAGELHYTDPGPRNY